MIPYNHYNRYNHINHYNHYKSLWTIIRGSPQGKILSWRYPFLACELPCDVGAGHSQLWPLGIGVVPVMAWFFHPLAANLPSSIIGLHRLETWFRVTHPDCWKGKLEYLWVPSIGQRLGCWVDYMVIKRHANIEDFSEHPDTGRSTHSTLPLRQLSSQLRDEVCSADISIPWVQSRGNLLPQSCQLVDELRSSSSCGLEAPWSLHDLMLFKLHDWVQC